MSPAELDETRYAESWATLNVQLREIEQGPGGLPAAIEALEAQQRAVGFIRHDPSAIRRYTFRNAERPSRFFRAQYNPSRVHRFRGAGSAIPPHGVTVAHAGCFLCVENIRWQQAGLELGYEIDVAGTAYIAWMNPFPLMPGSFVVAHRDHVPQGWSANGSAPELPRLDRILADLASLSERLPGYLGFHNGVGAGASIPSHLHFHFFRRRDKEDVYPLEAAVRDAGLAAHGPIADYPVEALYWSGSPTDVTTAASDWIRQWIGANRASESRISANIVATHGADRGLELYFVPRDQSRSHAPELAGGIGGLEILGEVPFCTAEEGRRLEEGRVDYHALERILAAVRFG